MIYPTSLISIKKNKNYFIIAILLFRREVSYDEGEAFAEKN